MDMDNDEKRKSALLLIEVAGLRNCLTRMAYLVAHIRDHSFYSVMVETPEESQKNYESLFDSALDKIKLTACEKLEEIFSEEELKELNSLYENPLVQKFLKSVNGESELYRSINNLAYRLQDEVQKEMEIKMQMLRCDSSTALKN